MRAEVAARATEVAHCFEFAAMLLEAPVREGSLLTTVARGLAAPALKYAPGPGFLLTLFLSAPAVP